MEKVKERVKCLGEIIDKMSEIVKIEACSTDPSKVDYENSGNCADMIKDLAEAEMNLWKSLYYKQICEAMARGEGEDEGPYGYNRNRYANGEYAPSGRGNRSMGFKPDMRIMDEDFPQRTGRSGYRPMNEDWDPEFGEHYNYYLEAKRHYHESGQKEDMDMMDTHAMEHIKSAVKSFKEIYKNASPSTKKALKEDLSKLVGEM